MGMEIGRLEHDSYRAAQSAQAAYIMAIRDLARSDCASAACVFKVTKEEARILSETSVHDLELALHNTPPILTVVGQETLRNASPMGALLEALSEGPEQFHNTAAHISAFNGPVNKAVVEGFSRTSKAL